MRLWQNLTDLFDPQQVNTEMTKRYQGTILGIRSGGRNFYASYKGLDNDGFHMFRDEQNVAIRLADNTEYDVFIPVIKPGLYNTAEGVAAVNPLPNRQWKRGLCSNNMMSVRLYMMFNNMMQNNTFANDVHDILNEEMQLECDLDIAKEQLSKGAVSHAINRDFAIQLDHNGEGDPYLFYHQSIVGRVGTHSIIVMNEVFRQEIMDSQRYWCPNYEVI